MGYILVMKEARKAAGMKWKYISDIGRIRDQNEDYVLLDTRNETAGVLGIVCDGIGGCLAGEVASEEAAEIMRSAFWDQMDETPDIHNALVYSLKRANARVWHLSASEDEYMGMGTTLTAVWTDGKTAWFASVGDSRGYIFHDGTLSQVTEDQSYVWDLYRHGSITKEQMLSHPMNHLVSMAVGLKPELGEQDIGLTRQELSSGDIIMLCSDGLTDVIPEADIEFLIDPNAPLEETAKALIDQANHTSGKDNISILLIMI